MSSANETRILRERLVRASDAFDAAQAAQEAYGSAALLCQTTTVSTYPTTAQAYYACNPVSCDGTEAEGQAVTYTPDTSTTLFALNIGTTVPPSGSRVICHSVGGRWCFRWD